MRVKIYNQKVFADFMNRISDIITDDRELAGLMGITPIELSDMRSFKHGDEAEVDALLALTKIDKVHVSKDDILELVAENLPDKKRESSYYKAIRHVLDYERL